MLNVAHKLLVTGKDVMRLHQIQKKVQCCSQPVGHRKRCNEIAFHKNVQYHSLPIGNRKRSDETGIQKMCNVTYSLLAIGKDVRRHFPKCVPLTAWWS